LYSRIGTTEVEKPTGLLFQQSDLDSALQVARAEVLWPVVWGRAVLVALEENPVPVMCK
jgi:hypothetical protein